MNGAESKMRVFLDTNVLFSAVVFPKSIARQAFEEILNHHVLVICEYSLVEMERILREKVPHKIPIWDRLITGMKFELAYTPLDQNAYSVPRIRDDKDLAILVSAYIAQPDLLVTGDKDFHTGEIREIFIVCTPGEFLQRFSQHE
jgi:putative PIN family toxin of toxin-antitoxin system